MAAPTSTAEQAKSSCQMGAVHTWRMRVVLTLTNERPLLAGSDIRDRRLEWQILTLSGHSHCPILESRLLRVGLVEPTDFNRFRSIAIYAGGQGFGDVIQFGHY